MRLLLSVALVAGMCALAGADEEKKLTVTQKVEALKKEFKESAISIQREFAKAKTDEEKTALREKFFALRPKFAEKALELATSDPKDDGACEAAVFAMGMGGGSPAGEKAAELITSTFVNSPKLKSSLVELSHSPTGDKFLKTIREKTTDKDIKGLSSYLLAAKALEEADSPRGNPMTAEQQAAAFKAIGEQLTAISKEYGNVELDEGRRKQTLAKAVEGQLFFLNNLTVGKVLPDSVAQTLDGKTAKISDYRGKVVVLDIWATWCGPCRAMIPHERELVKRLKDEPFVFISLSADEEKETLEKFLAKEPMPWTHWWNGGKDGPVADYKVQFFPTVYVLDEKGVIRFKHVREKKMDEAIDSLLKK